MKQIFLIFSVLISFSNISKAQVFWTESFQAAPGLAGCDANAYVGINGAWTTAATGFNDTDPSVWYVSGEECGNSVGACGTACAGIDPSLHIGSNASVLGDIGAAFLSGGFGFWFVETAVRAQSPIINCTGKTNITLSFNYIEDGDGFIDDATLWYFNGLVWAQIDPLAKTSLLCAPQGKWTAFSILLPVSANNNPNVRIGFNWINNDDGIGDDPTIAVDDITLSVPTVSSSISVSLTLPSPVCQTNTITASFTSTSSPSTFSWTASSGSVLFSAPNSGTTNISFSAPGTYTVFLTACQGSLCATTSSTIQVISAPSITVSPLTSTICLGQSANLIASGGTTYTWTASSGATPPSVSNVTVSPLVNTTYTVLSGSGTCTAQAVSSVVVAPAFSLICAPSSTTICTGGPGVVLTVSGATSYTWSGVGLSTTTGSIVTATPLVNTTYTIVGDNGSCSSATLITVNVTSGSATVTASSTSYCTGGLAVTLTGSGATTYSWSPAAGLSSTSGAIVTATPTVSTVYTVVGTTGLCTSTKTISITVSTTTSLSIASTGTVICPGSSGVTLTGSGVSTYTWLPGATSVNPLLVNPATTTIYTLTGTSAGGCLATPAVITVSVLPSISPVLSSSSASVCLTKTVTLSATPVGAGYSYTWSPGSAIQGPVNGASIVAKPISAASPVIYTLLISNGVCVETSTIALNVIVCSPPVSSFNTLTNDSICTGGCVTFTATSSGTPPLTYQWFFAGGTPPFSTLASPQVCYFAAGNYTVALVTANPFGTDTIIKLNYINVADTPSVVRGFGDTLIKIGQVAPIHATGATYYQWTPNNGTIACPSCSNTVVQPTVTTQYIVIGSNSPYCKRQDTILVKVDFTCGDFFVPNVFSPNGDGLNDVIMVNGFCIGTFNMKIFSRWGEKVFESSEKSNGWDGTYKGKPMDTGVFIYKVDGITIEGKPFVIKGNITLIR